MVKRNNNGNGRRFKRPQNRPIMRAPIDLTQFNNRRTVRVAYGLLLNTDQSVTNWQLNKRTLGSAVNNLWGLMTSPDYGTEGFQIEQVRIRQVSVQFDNRGVPTGGAGSVAFASNPRVGAYILPYTEAELKTLQPQDIADWAGMAVSQGTRRIINLPIGPEFSIGRFGSATENPGDTRLMIWQSGFSGQCRVVITYEVCGYPNQTVALTTTQEFPFSRVDSEIPPPPRMSTIPEAAPDTGGSSLDMEGFTFLKCDCTGGGRHAFSSSSRG